MKLLVRLTILYLTIIIFEHNNLNFSTATTTKKPTWFLPTKSPIRSLFLTTPKIKTVGKNIKVQFKGTENEADSSSCFECTSLIEGGVCPEKMESGDKAFVLMSCQGAYCVKYVGVHKGVWGTTRSCSSRDMGNECRYIPPSNEDLVSPSCVYTCKGDKCNPADPLTSSKSIIITSILTIKIIFFILHSLMKF